ncbi:MAG: sugar phosphate nucleotidyltransferase [Fimbriimonadaceae bacterium]
MKGVILAAGKGSRLFPVTHHIPKPILPLANRMTIEYAFDRLKEIGISEVCVVVGESEPRMREALGDGSSFGISLAYVRQTEPKGLAHAVGFAKDFVAGDSFALYLGDAIYSDGFETYARHFTESGCANLNIVKPVEDPSRFGVANVEGWELPLSPMNGGERGLGGEGEPFVGPIQKLVEKPTNPESNLAMAGLYFFGPEIWSVLPDLEPSPRGEFEITDAIQLLIDRGENVLAGVYEGTWFDTGTLDSFLATSSFLVGGGQLIDPASQVRGAIGESVVVGQGAILECLCIEDSVILPGAEIRSTGAIKHSLLGGRVSSDELEGVIEFGLS